MNEIVHTYTRDVARQYTPPKQRMQRRLRKWVTTRSGSRVLLAQTAVAQQMPGGFFGFCLRVAPFANALGADAHD
jgi:hypothetical protein